ncbi:glutaredoxin [Clostridium sp. Marseille-P2415]|uniref:glutaredoxin n=1 Tax=Clostridium sp. Marseille-P2415 TaxID=1805471 RepID=UPI0009888489|nr:glutaredoxin [Clostridium sp. Marseille-P2415]
MKVNVIGSHLCPDTIYAICKLKEKKAEIVFSDLSASFPALRDYLEIREHDSLFENVKRNGGFGIPFFILEDGMRTLNLDEVLNKL